jgi:ATP-dependent exoDNAse (exonuclease V) beta subunit
MDTEKLLTEAVDVLISRVGENEKLTRLLMAFTEAKAEEDKNWKIESDILSFSKNLLKEDNARFLDSLRNIDTDVFFETIKILRKKREEYLNILKKIGDEGVKVIEENALEMNDFSQGNRGIARYYYYLSEPNAGKILPNSFVVKTVEEDKWWSAKCSAQQKNKIEEIKDELTSLYLDAQDVIKEHHQEFLVIDSLLPYMHSMGVLQELEMVLEEIKSEQNILPIAEFNKRISEIVRNESAPFIYERIGEKYHHFLIDEFQDTSIMQWQNLLPLIHNSLSSGYFNMIVGDGKQSIYRWRGGEVEQFSSLPKIYSREPLNDVLIERQQSLEYAYSEKMLNKNWRSKKEIIQFNNDFFRFIADAKLDTLKKIYENLEQEFDDKKSGGWITLDIVPKLDNNFNEIESEEFIDITASEKSLQIMLEYIKKHIQNGYTQKDICIICRKKTEGQMAANYLIENGLNVISPDSLLLANNKHVQFLINTLHYSIDREDREIQVKMLEYLFEQSLFKHPFPDEIYLKIARKEKYLEALLKEQNIYLSRELLIKQSLFDAVESIVRLFKLQHNPDPYIQFFLNAVFDFSTKRNNSIQDFLEWFNQKSNDLSIIVPEGSDAIQIMTIHKSKGLEFPVVIMPFANWQFTISENVLWVDIPENIEIELPSGLISARGSDDKNPFNELRQHEKNKSVLDSINLLYVAFTRAVDALHIILVEPKNNTNTFKYFTDYLKYKYPDYNQAQVHYDIVPLLGQAKPHHKEVAVTDKFQKLISNPWYEKLQLSLTAPEAWNIDNPDQASEYGKQLHDVLANINSENEMQQVIELFLFEGNIDREEAGKIKHEINNIVSHPLLNKYFKGEYKARNEIEIIDKDGKSYRPDKIFIKEKDAVIIDFKTGKKSKSHESQIENYSNLLQGLGYTVSQKYLCYTQSNEVIEV